MRASEYCRQPPPHFAAISFADEARRSGFIIYCYIRYLFCRLIFHYDADTLAMALHAGGKHFEMFVITPRALLHYFIARTTISALHLATPG